MQNVPVIELQYMFLASDRGVTQQQYLRLFSMKTAYSINTDSWPQIANAAVLGKDISYTIGNVKKYQGGTQEKGKYK